MGNLQNKKCMANKRIKICTLSLVSEGKCPLKLYNNFYFAINTLRRGTFLSINMINNYKTKKGLPQEAFYQHE